MTSTTTTKTGRSLRQKLPKILNWDARAISTFLKFLHFGEHETNLLRFQLLVALSLSFIGCGRLPNVLFVNPTATGDKSGSSWDNAMTDLQAAIGKTDSSKAMQIWVAKGIYRPTAGADRNASFILKKNITLIGGFAGNELSPDSRKISDNTTILTGEIGAAGNTYDNSRHVVTGATGSTLDGFTITQGSTDTALGTTDMG